MSKVKKATSMKAIPQSKNGSIPAFSDLPPGFTVGNHKNGEITQLAAANKSNHLPRYSDAKLQEFKALLEKREVKERNELAFVNDCLNSNNEHGGFSEDGSAVSNEKEQLNQRKGRIMKTLENIENAKARIRNKDYGRCIITNKLIDEARLRAHPWATQSVAAKLQAGKN